MWMEKTPPPQKKKKKKKKRAIRIVTNSKFSAHTDPLFKSLKLLKIKDVFM